MGVSSLIAKRTGFAVTLFRGFYVAATFLGVLSLNLLT